MAVTRISSSGMRLNNKYNSVSGTQPRNNAVVASTTGSPTIASANGYTYYAFTGDGTITFEKSGLCAIMAVGAGASGVQIYGSNSGGGGGGAGGIHSGYDFLVQADTYTVEVGAGGSGSSLVEGLVYGVKGGQSSGGNDGTGGSGGSGGGAGQPSNVVGQPVTGQGNPGGQSNGNYGGGGGGAGEPGSTDGNALGGDGTAEFSDWGIATGTGHDVGGIHYFAGGGGGGGGNAQAGGDGGGGTGNNNSAPGAGLVNTGGGGGGSRRGGNSAGGSGIVIVRIG